MIRLLRGFFTGRRFAVQMEKATSSWRYMHAGLAQGSPLSPILYSIRNCGPFYTWIPLIYTLEWICKFWYLDLRIYKFSNPNIKFYIFIPIRGIYLSFVHFLRSYVDTSMHMLDTDMTIQNKFHVCMLASADEMTRNSFDATHKYVLLSFLKTNISGEIFFTFSSFSCLPLQSLPGYRSEYQYLKQVGALTCNALCM